ncbi:MAG: hypothetical protein Unbinned1322contig1000_42 [Prokaryotic dsDNA virus sp.]|nr:hypothetical protein [Aequorivita sp.]QDP57298.1 MAG: hypothetical protein Unbinned1322contig1000_42 [Prokaryotic dsDNA virus sp.]|tara:strand:- start:21786 stop:25010 length:3225 start_codon:yes stop_codon:yes gene_type:complete
MKKLLFFVLLFLSLAANAQMTQLGGSTGVLDGGAGGGGGGGGGAGTIAVWSPATAYLVNEIAIYDGTIFIRTIPGTTATAPDADITNWSPVGLNAAPSHVATTYYHIGQVVEFGGAFYKRLTAGISAGDPDVDPVNWESPASNLGFVAGILAQANGGTGVDASALANGEIFIGNGAGFVSATLTGTLNQVAIANGAGSITLSTPQDIHSGASPTFVSATFSGVSANEFVKTDGASGLTSASSIDLTADVSGILPVDNGGTGLDTSAAANGTFLIGNGTGFDLNVVSGTANQVTATPSAGGLTLSTPQDIHSGASPTFVSATFSGVTANEFVKTDGASGITSVPTIDFSDITGIIPQDQGGTGVDASALANGEIFIGNGAGFVSATITGTANQLDVTNGAGSITLSTPQDIHSGASPTFVSATFSGVAASEFIKTDGASGLTSVASIDLTSDVATSVLPIANGGTNSNTALNNDRILVSSAGAIVEAAALTDGQILLGSSGAAPVAANLTGTINQVDIANSSGSVTFSLPQDIDVAATPTFVSATFSGLTASEFVKTDGASGLTTSASIDFGDLTGIVPQDQGGTGFDAIASATDGQLLIGSTGAGFVSSTLTGTLNQVDVANTSGSITLSLPQDIHSGASPTFVGATLTGLTPGSVTFVGAADVIAEDNGNFFFDSGNTELGIGTAAPTAQLHIDGANVGTVQLQIDSANGQTANIVEVKNFNGSTEHVIVDADGDVGINEASPTKDLHVSGGVQFDLISSDNFTLDGSTDPRTITLGAFRQDHTPGIPGTSAHRIVMESSGFDDTHGVRVENDLAGESGVTSTNLSLEANVAGMTNTNLFLIDAQKVGAEGAGSEVIALHVGNSIDVIKQEAAIAQNSDLSFTDDGGFTDVSADFNSSASDIEIFSNDNAYIYVSSDFTFSSIEVLLDTAANNTITPVFEYSQGGASWGTVSVSDTTSGFQLNGVISFTPPGDWAVDSVNGSANKFWFRIQRTRNGLATPPIEDSIQITPAQTFGWDSQANLSIRTISASEGFIAPSLSTIQRDVLTPSAGQHIFNTDLNQSEYYNGTAWISY